MFGKTRESIDKLSGRVEALDFEMQRLRTSSLQDRTAMIHKLESVETWMELAVDLQADRIADRFDELLREHSKTGKVTNQVLKDLVRQAAKGQ